MIRIEIKNKDTSLKERAEFIVQIFEEKYIISKITPFEELIEKEIGNFIRFSFEINTYNSDKTQNEKGILFKVFVLNDGYVYLDYQKTELDIYIEEKKEPNFFDYLLGNY